MIARVHLPGGAVVFTDATPAEIRELAEPGPQPVYLVQTTPVLPASLACECGRLWTVQAEPTGGAKA